MIRKNKPIIFPETFVDLGPIPDIKGYSDQYVARAAEHTGMSEAEWLESVNGFRLNITKCGLR